MGLNPGWYAKILHALGPKSQNIKLNQYCNKFNKDFKNDPQKKKKTKQNKYLLKRKKKELFLGKIRGNKLYLKAKLYQDFHD